MRNRLAFASIVILAACGKVSDGTTDAPEAQTATLTVVRDGSGTGTVTSSPAGINCGADCTEDVVVGTAITLTATPDASATFMGWSGGGCSGTGTCAVTVTADTAVTAMFVMNRSLTVVRDGSGTGTVTSSPAGIICGADCSEVYADGTVVTLTAVGDVSSTFTGWTGGGCSGTGTCVVTLDAALSVTATFTLNRYALRAIRSGNGSGSIDSSSAGIACGGDCTEDYDHGTIVTLTATPTGGSSFVGWSGGGCSGTGTCMVTMLSATDVTGTFMLDTHGVTVMKGGNGAGTVTSSPAGINCGTDCSESYNFGTVVTLTATPSTGSTFTGWSGGGCTGTGACVITVMAATPVTATFTLTQHTLTVTRAGTGTGTVTSTPAGINCGADCTETVNYGTVLTLGAAPASGSTFTGWSGGGCSGTGACVVGITAATTVTATFTLNSYTLSVTRAGSGSGTVTSSPAGINCGTVCAAVYNHGTVVTLTATPTAGQSFTGWTGGGCSGTGTCVVTLTAATSVTATFVACPSGSTTFSYTGALQTFTVPSCVTSITIDAYGAQGGTATGEGSVQNIAGGLGARARGTVAVTGGQTISVLVGGMGGNATCASAGGGGSFVVRSGAALVVAGGGGGGFHCTYLGPVTGGGGVTTTSGGSGICAVHPTYMAMPSPGGTNGSGATAGYGGGGGGFLSAGMSVNSTGAGGGAYPGAGGTPGGGYGGGGGSSSLCCAGAAGGGGYSGGGGAGGTFNDGCAGGGGGSINNGTAQIMTAAARAGNGTVIISY